MATQTYFPAPAIAAENLQAMLNFASKTILTNPALYQQAQQNSAPIVEQQITHWKSFQ